MVIGIVLISLSMFLTAFSFPSRASLLPKVAGGGATVVFGILILIQNQVSFNIRTSKDNDLISVDNNITDELDDTEADEAVANPELGWTIDKVILIALIGGYAVTGVLIGIFWVTPLFALLFLRWRGHSWIETATLAGVSAIVPYIMMRYLNINYMTGLLFGGI